MQGNDIRLLQHFFKGAALRIPASQDIGDIAENHAHAESFREIRQLRSDAAIAHDAEDQAPDFMGAGGGLVPLASVHLGARGENSAHEHDDLA